MSTKTTLSISIILVLVASLAGILLWNQLPDSMASHWNVNDQVNGYMPRFWGVFLMPLIATGMLLLFLVIPSMDPLKANIEQFREYFNTFITLIIAFLVYIHSLTLIWNLGYTGFRMSTAMLPALGLLFVFMGVLISKARRNYFIGIRTPWTLSSDRVWNETHRLGGKLYIAAGIFAFLGAFFPDQAIWFIMFPVIGASLISVIYSYILYRGEPKA
ncbi:MAG: SdpI family protein [Chloroflexi bacterium]|nr:SdpI family protein [Chloroflexota bacterium]